MTFNVAYDKEKDKLVITRGKVSPWFTKQYRPGLNYVVSKNTFKTIGIQFTGFVRNWTNPDRVCADIAHHFGIEPSDAIKLLVGLNTDVNRSG